MNDIIMVFNNLVFYIGGFLVFFMLLKDQFKVHPFVVLASFLIFPFLDIYLKGIGINAFIILLFAEISGELYAAPLYKGNILNCFILDYMAIVASNIFGNLGIIIMLLLKGVIGDNISWLNRLDTSITENILMDLFMIIGFIISYKLCKGIKLEILSLKGTLKWLFLLLVVSPTIINNLLKNLIFTEYNIEPSGIILILESIIMTATIIGLIALYAIKNKKIHKKNKENIEAIQGYTQNVSNQMELKEKLHELNHDIKNYMSSVRNEEKEYINNYCDEILDNLEES